MKMRHLSLFCLLITLSPLLSAQTIQRADHIRVTENGNVLDFPWAGGLNMPQFSNHDFNAAGRQDLFVFDRDGNVSLVFKDILTSGTPQYELEPGRNSILPLMNGWALLRDFDGDGLDDLFTGAQGSDNSIWVYRNTGSAGNPAFSGPHKEIQTDYGSGPAPLYVSSYDIPALVDVDKDGDLDVLTFNTTGLHVEFHSNQSMETYGHDDSLIFTLADGCWGKFQENGLNNSISLGITCKTNRSGTPTVQGHAGSSLCALDEDGDGDTDLLLGDLTHENLVYVRNGGNLQSALMDSTQYYFPEYDNPVLMDFFPAAFYVEVTGDSRNDLVVAPNLPISGENYESVLLYPDFGTSAPTEFSRTSNSFLQDEMIDFGRGSDPAFFDYNGDGLMDLVIGNNNLKTSASETAGLALYENIGTSSYPEFELVDRDYLSLSSLFSPALIGISPAFGDLDGDGDEDLIIGDSNGWLHYLENSAGAGNVASFSLAGYNYKSIDVGGYATPAIADLNSDGKPDLVVGESMGSIRYFENIGSTSVPDFAQTPTLNQLGHVDIRPVCCTGYANPYLWQDSTGNWQMVVGSESGGLFFYDALSTSATDTFVVQDTAFLDISVGIFAAVAAADLDGDQSLDWVAGNLRGGLTLYGVNSVSAREAQISRVPLEVFPVPAGDLLQVKIPGEGFSGAELEISVVNLAGQVLMRETGQNLAGVQKINISQLPSGMFLLRVGDGLGNYGVCRFVKR